MGGDKQIQKAGDCSQQIQANNIINVNVGITEDRAVAIFTEQFRLAIKEYTEDSRRAVDERVGKFEKSLIPRIMHIENAAASFADPSFQLLLRQALQTAATTDREPDYDLLTELLICHVEEGKDRKNKAGINRAVQIVGDIDNDALCGLTVAYAFLSFGPITGDILQAIHSFDDLFNKLIYQELPSGGEWLDHLDVLGAIRLLPFNNSTRTQDHYSTLLDGYVCAGLKSDSEEYKKSIAILSANGLDGSFLVPNDCLNDYFRLAIRSKLEIDKPDSIVGQGMMHLEQNQKDALKQIFAMYSNDIALKSQAKKRFFEIWDSYETLHKLSNWWDRIPQSFSITSVGRALARTNAKRCEPNIRD